MRRLGNGPDSPAPVPGGLATLLVPLALLGLLGLVFLGSFPAAAEHPNHAQGFRPENTFELGDIENVNLFNGNLTLTIPIGPSFPVGPGLSYGLVLTYSGNLWEWEETVDQIAGRNYLQALVRRRSNAGLGWELGFGRLLGGAFPSNHETTEVYLGPDQSQHTFFPRLHPGEESHLHDGIQYTQDSTYLRLREPEVSDNTFRVESPDGVIRTFRPSDGRLALIEDPFGNSVTITYSGDDSTTDEYSRWTVTDSHGREQIIDFTQLVPVPHLGMVVSKVTLEGFGPQPMEYLFEYTTPDLARPCNDPLVCQANPTRLCGASQLGAVKVPLLRKVTLPDGSAYEMPEATGTEPDAYHLDVPETIIAQTSCTNRAISGQLEALDLPTGGRYEWSWKTYYFPIRSQRVSPRYKEFAENYPDSPFNRSVGLAERRHYDQGSKTALGTWTYSQSIEFTGMIATEVWTEVARYPVGGVTRHLFSGYVDDGDTRTTEPEGFVSGEYGLPLSRRTLDGTSGRALSQEVFDSDPAFPTTTHLRTVYVDYDRSGDNDSRANPRVVSERTVYENDTAPDGLRYAQTDFSGFDGLGHFRTMATTGNFFGADDRTTFTNYNPTFSTSTIPAANAAWVLGTYTDQRVTEGGQTFRREACFDLATGFLERTRTFALTAPAGVTPARSGSDLIVKRSPTPGTGFVQNELFFGGDGAGLSTGSDLCSIPLPPSPAYQQSHTYTAGVLATSAWAGTSFLSVHRTIDGETGLISSSRDTAGFLTSYDYDTMGRLVSEEPEEGAVTAYSYRVANGSTPARVTIETRENLASNTALTTQEILFDGFGRAEVERRLMPGGLWAERTTLRNALGQVYQRSEWEPDGDPEPSVTQYGLFDPFGRPGRIILPDGRQIDLSYTGVSQRYVKVPVGTTLGAGGTVTTTTATTAEYYDRFGRLAEVREPIDPGNKPRTLYTYDALDNLTTVRQDFGETPSQTRTFSYDGRGLLTAETHPELGAAVLYSQYDALGNPGRRQVGTDRTLEGGWDLSYAYDEAGRLVRIDETYDQDGNPATPSDLATRVWKNWVYATANNQAGLWSNGRLASATRHNYVLVPGQTSAPIEGELHVPITESYSYDGLGGRISRVTTEVTAGNEPHFRYDLSYDTLGNVTSRTYPVCFDATPNDGRDFQCPNMADPQTRVVGQGFGQGLLTSVADFAGAITYHPSGLVEKVSHTNGVTDLQARDPDDMARPLRIRTVGASADLDTGPYAYDGAGNVTGIGKNTLTYDLLSRLVQAELSAEADGCGEQELVEFQTLPSVHEVSSCGEVIGRSSTVTSTGDVTFRAGRQVVLGDGFSVAAGGSFRAVVDPSTGPETGVSEASWTGEYDRFGNLLAQTPQRPGETAVRRTAATNSATNRLTATGTAYDLTGNVTAWGNQSYRYDPFNMLREMPSYRYLYGPGDERLWVVDTTRGTGNWLETYTLRDLDGSVLRELETDGGDVSAANWSIRRDSIWRGSSLLAFATPSTTHHVHLDHLGTPRLITDETGTTLAYHAYFPFGEEATDPTQDAQRAKFTAHERDFHHPNPPIEPEDPLDLAALANISDDLDYMHARYFSPHLGRFMSVDPSQESFNPKKPQSWNRYAYVRGNPLKYVDPDGRVITPSLLGNPEGIDDLTPEEQRGVLMMAGTMAGLITVPFAIEAGIALYAQLLLRPEVALTALQIVGAFADDLRSGGGASSVQVYTKLAEAPQAGRALSTAAGEGGRALAEAARETGKLFTAKFPKALLTKLEQAGFIERRLTMMNGKVAIEIRFSEKATEALAKYFREVPAE